MNRSSFSILLSTLCFFIQFYTVCFADFNFGTISAVKSKVKELSEKVEKEKKEGVVIGTTGPDGTLTFFDKKLGSDIIIKTTAKTNSAPVSDVEIKYLNTGTNIICEATDPSDRYFPQIVIMPVAQYRLAPRPVVAETVIIGLTLNALSVGKVLYDYTLGNEDLPDMDLIRNDAGVVCATIEGDFNDLWNLMTLASAPIPFLSYKASIAKSGTEGLVSIGFSALKIAVKERLDISSFDTAANYKLMICDPVGSLYHIGAITVLDYINHGPLTPSTPGGQSSLTFGQSGSYSVSTTDQRNLQVKYGWDWNGDGTADEWSSLGSSGWTDSRTHSWTSTGTYSVRVKAQNAQGVESGWSNALTVAVSGSGGSVGAWNKQVVASVGNVGQYCNLALDLSGNPHIVYYDATNDDLKYTKWTGTTWNSEVIDTNGVEHGSSVILDGNNKPHISYSELGKLKYANLVGSNWNIQEVDSNSIEFNSIQVDSNNNPHIVYRKASDLKYAYWNSSWTVSIMDSNGDAGLGPSIALDASNNPHISYWEGSADTLKYGKKVGSWTTQNIDSPVDYNTSITLGTNGYPHIAYYHRSYYLKYAKWTGTTFSNQIIDTKITVKYCSIALDSSGDPHIAYYDATNGNLKYAKWTGSAWKLETIDSTGDVGQYSSIALDSNGKPHIAYYDATNKDLKYITLSQ